MQLEDSNSLIAIKSKSGKFLNASRGLAELTGFDGYKQMLGLDDYQIAGNAYTPQYYDINPMVEEFLLDDEEALRGQNFFVFHTVLIQNKFVSFILHKQPYHENNKIVGSQFHGVVFPNQNEQTLKPYLSNPDIVVSAHTKKHIDVLKLAPYKKYGLSKRELQCVQLLVKNFSARDIADHLGLSPRTVESYISNAKEKLQVKKNTEIIILAISEGLV